METSRKYDLLACCRDCKKYREEAFNECLRLFEKEEATPFYYCHNIQANAETVWHNMITRLVETEEES